MQKLSGKRGIMLSKSWKVLRTKTNKVEFVFFCFSSIFYGFYKFQQKGFTIEDLTFKQAPGSFVGLTEMPLVCIKALGNKKNLAMWSLGVAGGGPTLISARSSALKTGKGRGRAPGSSRARLLPELETRAAPVS
jgi:hypothetical protein